MCCYLYAAWTPSRGRAHLQRPAFPTGAWPYSAGFVIRLQPFSRATIEHFQYLERPHGA